jgi:undecaprenyl-diphosphatase
MTDLQVIVLAIVQGLTEFLPISSSGHLVLVPSFFGWSDQGLAFDVAMHFGSLTAVLIYFRQDIVTLLRGTSQVLTANFSSFESRLALAIGLGTIPAAVVGLALGDWIGANLRSPVVIAGTLSGYAVLMFLADRLGKKTRDLRSIGFSFLLAVPVILLATAYELTILAASEAPVAWGQLAFGAAVSALVAYLSIEFFMRFVNRVGLLPFVLYRIALAAVILYVLA